LLVMTLGITWAGARMIRPKEVHAPRA